MPPRCHCNGRGGLVIWAARRCREALRTLPYARNRTPRRWASDTQIDDEHKRLVQTCGKQRSQRLRWPHRHASDPLAACIPCPASIAAVEVEAAPASESDFDDDAKDFAERTDTRHKKEDGTVGIYVGKEIAVYNQRPLYFFLRIQEWMYWSLSDVNLPCHLGKDGSVQSTAKASELDAIPA